MRTLIATALISLFSSSLSFAKTESVVLDVRTPEEFAEIHVVGAQNINVLAPDFVARISVLDKSLTYKVYCRSGNRSGRAVKIMQEHGFEHVENIGSVREAAKHLDRGCESNTGQIAC